MDKKNIKNEVMAQKPIENRILFADSSRTTTALPVYNEQGTTCTQNPFDRINSDNAKIIWMLSELMMKKEASVQKSDLMDRDEVSEMLTISTSTLYKLTANKKIPFFKREGSNKLLFSRIALDTWVKESQAPNVNLIEKQLHMNLRVRKVQNN